MDTGKVFVVVLSLLTLAHLPCHAAPSSTVLTQAEVGFGKDCETVVRQAIKESQQEALVAIYTFTRRSIADELIKAAKRGVDVEVKLDAKQAEWDGMQDVLKKLKLAGIKVTLITLKPDRAKMHHKFIVIDGRCVITGSYNFTTTATTVNHENVVKITSTSVAAAYKSEFKHIHSVR